MQYISGCRDIGRAEIDCEVQSRGSGAMADGGDAEGVHSGVDTKIGGWIVGGSEGMVFDYACVRIGLGRE